MLSTLKILSLNYDIAIYDYTNNNNTLNINDLLDDDYDYVITIDYVNQQLDIDLYQRNSILFNINIANTDAFNLFIDALNKDNNLNYSIIKINKYALTF